MKLQFDYVKYWAGRAFHSERFSQAAAIIGVVCFAYGFYSLVTYSLPMAREQYPTAVHSRTACKYELFYSAALKDYAEKNYELSKKLASLAFEDLQPNIRGNELLAADILFLQGKALQQLGKKDKAIDIYEQALRLNPKLVACKYNLEMLQPPPQGGGGGGGQGQSGGQGKDGKSQDGKPQDGKPQDGKPQDGKPQDGKPKDGKPDDGKPEDGKDHGDKSNHGKPKPKI